MNCFHSFDTFRQTAKLSKLRHSKIRVGMCWKPWFLMKLFIWLWFSSVILCRWKKSEFLEFLAYQNKSERNNEIAFHATYWSEQHNAYQRGSRKLELWRLELWMFDLRILDLRDIRTADVRPADIRPADNRLADISPSDIFTYSWDYI